MLIIVGRAPLAQVVKVHVDDANGIIHVLDLDNGGKTVTNGIEDDPDNWKWYLYGTDGVVSEWAEKDGTFRFVDLNDETVHRDFGVAMMLRG